VVTTDTIFTLLTMVTIEIIRSGIIFGAVKTVSSEIIVTGRISMEFVMT
jgi:hypothetical protein